jgi:hypothetical protein
MPASGASRQKKRACNTARVVPPRNFPSGMAAGERGATRAPCKKPSRRSSITEIVEKIAVKSMIRRRMPGKK